jgi:hypothetical protein
MIDMVTDLILACFDDFSVHPYSLSLAIFSHVYPTDCIKRTLALQSIPFIPAQTPEIIRVHDCEHSPRQRYSPEGIAVANSPIQKNRKNQQPLNRCRNVDDNLNNLPLPPGVSGEIRHSKH